MKYSYMASHRSVSRLWTGAVTVAGLVTGMLLASVPNSWAATPLGLWYAEGGAAQVEIRECDTALCGRVVWLRSPLDTQGCELRDGNNPDATLRNRVLLGLTILHGLTSSDSEGKEWTGGTVYDPASGKTYRCSLTLDGEHRLHLRGYIGIPLLGRTTTWIRVGTEQQQCSQ